MNTRPVAGIASTSVQGDFLKDNKKLSLENHYTLYEQNNGFFFSELNAHRLFSNNTYIANVGGGYRHITSDDSAVGLNAFYDQGLSRNKSNGSSVGFEYLRNDFYLNSNFYFKGSEGVKKVGDYTFNNGVDINAQYYIPRTPLSLKASYLYSQKEANLISGSDSRAKGMYKVGVEFTPVRMFSVGYEYGKMHDGDRHENHQVYARININTGVSLADQLAWNTNQGDFADYVRNRKVERNLLWTVAREDDFVKEPVITEPPQPAKPAQPAKTAQPAGSWLGNSKRGD